MPELTLGFTSSAYDLLVEEDRVTPANLLRLISADIVISDGQRRSVAPDVPVFEFTTALIRVCFGPPTTLILDDGQIELRYDGGKLILCVGGEGTSDSFTFDREDAATQLIEGLNTLRSELVAKGLDREATALHVFWALG